jgi:hypothetical protein
MPGLRASVRFYPGAFDDSRYRQSQRDAPVGSRDDRAGTQPAAVPVDPAVPDLVIVRRDETGVYEYLSMRMRGLESVELRIDQRRDTPERRADDRRDPRRGFNVFGVQVVRRGRASPESSGVSPSR